SNHSHCISSWPGADRMMSAAETALPWARSPPPGWIATVATIALTCSLSWGAWLLILLFHHGLSSEASLSLVWFICFALLWWIPLAWMERPFRANKEKTKELDRLFVTVQIPIYNEDP